MTLVQQDWCTGGAYGKWGRAAVGGLLALALLTLVGWATGATVLTRMHPGWPATTPWVAVWMTTLGIAIAAQSGSPSPGRVRLGRGLAVMVVATASLVLVEYMTGRSLGLDQLWFAEAIEAEGSRWPRRPSIPAAAGYELMSCAVALTRLERRWAGIVWPPLIAFGALIPSLAIVGTLLGDAVLTEGPWFAVGISGAVGLVLAALATIAVRPDRSPLSWVSSQPDPGGIVRLVIAVTSAPVVAAVLMTAFGLLGIPARSQWTLTVLVGTVILGVWVIASSARTWNKLARLAELLKAETSRLESELDSAAMYMSSIMPSGLEGEVRIQSRYLPARQLGGDCFDYGWIDDDHLQVYLIDVSGHGIEPALLAASVHHRLRIASAVPEELLHPESVLADLNSRFQMATHDDHFFTIWYGVYEASTRVLRYCAAGTPPAVVVDPCTGALTELGSIAPPVGVLTDIAFVTSSYRIPRGSRLLIFSDGVYEFATAGSGQELSLTGLEDLVKSHARKGADLDDLVSSLKALSANGAFDDDRSLLQLDFDWYRSDISEGSADIAAEPS